MKAVLVMEMPERCEDCQLRGGLFCCYGIKNGDFYPLTVAATKGRQDWCPLRPISEDDSVLGITESWEKGFKEGYAYCRGELLKAIEGSGEDDR